MKRQPSTLARLWHFRTIASPVLSHNRGLLAACIALSLLFTFLELLRPQPIRLLFDGVLLPNIERLPAAARAIGFEDWSTLKAIAWICAAVLLLGASSALVNYVLETRLAYLGNKVVSRLRKVVFRHLLELPNLFYDTQKTGDLVLRLTGDIQMIRELIVNFVVSIAGRVTLILGMATVMIWMNPRLALLALGLMPLLAWATTRAAEKVRVFTRRQREQESSVAQSVG